MKHMKRAVVDAAAVLAGAEAAGQRQAPVHVQLHAVRQHLRRRSPGLRVDSLGFTRCVSDQGLKAAGHRHAVELRPVKQHLCRRRYRA